jgi:hypothetical protein
MVRAAAVGAAMNVAINLQSMAGDAEADAMLLRAQDAVRRTSTLAVEVEREVWRRLGRDSEHEVKNS